MNENNNKNILDICCDFCGAEVCPDAAFCEKCGNVAGAEVSEEVDASFNMKCPTTWLRKLVWIIVGGIALYGFYIMWGDRFFYPIKKSQSTQSAASAEVLKAEERLRSLKSSIAEEDAQKRKAEEDAQALFKQQIEDAKKLRDEFSRKEEK
jgi:hypothetical protein